MTTYKMPKQPQDDVRTDLWSISFLSSVGGGARAKGGALAIFDLFNRVTNRAHRMTITAGGKTSGLPVGASFRDSSYIRFKTVVPANFPDFHERRAKLELKDRLGKSYRSVTVFQASILKELMKVKVNNWNLTGWHGFNGQGITEIYYSDGRPVGVPDYDLRIDIRSKEELPDNFEVVERDFGLVIRMPGDILFDFDRDWLHYDAEERVSDLFAFINALPEHYPHIEVEGHTDSKERVPGYNMQLSLRRAKTVRDYLTRNKWAFDREHTFGPPRGLGATQPVAPNTHPDGSDNPEGRDQNRRVEVFLYKSKR